MTFPETLLWGATLYTDQYEYTGDKATSPRLAFNGAVNHAKQDAVRNAIAAARDQTP